MTHADPQQCTMPGNLAQTANGGDCFRVVAAGYPQILMTSLLLRLDVE
jgi:hypothetical protein